MSNVTSTYYLGGVASRTKLVSLEGDSPENDLIALDKFEKYVESHYKSCYRTGKTQKYMRLEKTVSSEMVSIPLRATETERVGIGKYDPYPGEVTMVVYDRIDPGIAEVLIKEAKDRL